MHKLIPDEPYELSPDAARLVDEVNTAWDAAQELRGQLKIETERLAAIDPLKFKAADIQAKRKTREYTIKVLQLEIPLLVRLREWWQIRSRERHNAWTRAVKRCNDAIESICNKLREIGFDENAFAEIACKSGIGAKDQNAAAAERGIIEATYFHPSVAPHTFEARHLDGLRHYDADLVPAQTEARIATAEAALKNLISEL